MFIFYSAVGDPMLLDSPGGLRALERKFKEFLEVVIATGVFPGHHDRRSRSILGVSWRPSRRKE